MASVHETIRAMGKQRPDRLLALRDVSRRLVETRSLETLIWNLARSLGVDFAFPDCVIYLREDNELVQRAAYGPKNPVDRKIADPIRIPLGQGITGTCAASGRSILVPDVRLDPRYIADVGGGLCELAVPIIYADQVLGVIDTEADEVDFFGKEEQLTLEIIANMISPRIVTSLEEERRKIAERQLKQIRQRFRALLDSA